MLAPPWQSMGMRAAWVHGRKATARTPGKHEARKVLWIFSYSGDKHAI